MEMINNITNEQLSFWKVPMKDRSGGAGSESQFDVKVTKSKQKGKSTRISIIFGANLHKMLEPYKRAKVSSLSAVRDKMYFGFYTEEKSPGTYSLSRAKKEKNPNPTIQYTPTEEELAQLVQNWDIGGCYKLLYDDVLKVYYISNIERQ